MIFFVSNHIIQIGLTFSMFGQIAFMIGFKMALINMNANAFGKHSFIKISV